MGKNSLGFEINKRDREVKTDYVPNCFSCCKQLKHNDMVLVCIEGKHFWCEDCKKKGQMSHSEVFYYPNTFEGHHEDWWFKLVIEYEEKEKEKVKE